MTKWDDAVKRLDGKLIPLEWLVRLLWRKLKKKPKKNNSKKRKRNDKQAN